jgi:hypothetical protein
MIMATMSRIELRTWKESRLVSKIPQVGPTVKVLRVPTTADGRPKIDGPEAPGSL